MPTAADARRLALALSGTEESPYHGVPSFRVQGKMFANLPEAGRLHLMLPADEIEAAAAALPEACFGVPWGQKLGALGVWLERVQEDELEDLLRRAWRHRGGR